MDLSYKNKNGKYVYFFKNSEYDHEDEVIEISRSNLRRARNAHLILGVVGGVLVTLASIYLYFWTIGVF